MVRFLQAAENLTLNLLPEGRLKRRLQNRLEDLRFLVVGAIGFIVNFLVLWLLHGRLGLPLLLSQLIGAELALLSNFSLHHTWTYRDFHHSSLIRRLSKFHASAWTGALLSSLVVWASATYLGVHYMIALIIGAAVGLVWNYLVNKHIIWSKRPAQEPTA